MSFIRWLQDCAAAVADTLLSTQAMATRTFVALDLIAKGWAIWQPFVNASDVVHALIVLSMEQSSSPTPTEVRNAARLALLQVAAANTPLFIGCIFSALCLTASHVHTAPSLSTSCTTRCPSSGSLRFDSSPSSSVRSLY